MQYTELQVTSNFSFLRGASHPEELVEQAAGYGYNAIAITDRNSLAGIVRAHAASRKHKIRLIPACRLDLQDAPSVLVYPTNIQAYAQLCNLLTTGNLRTEKGKCELYREDLYSYVKGSKFIVVPPDNLDARFDFPASFTTSLEEYRSVIKDNLYIAATRYYNGDDGKRLKRIFQLSEQLDIPMVATNDVHYHHPSRRELQDVVTCVREKCTIYNAGFRLHPNAERYLKTKDEMVRLFNRYPDAIRQTQAIEAACRFSLDELRYEYPREITPEGTEPQEELTRLVWEGAHKMYGENLPEKIIHNINYELAFMKEMNYAKYFLTVYDIVRFAREQGILCQGRGSAANSTICYCLGITSVDPTQIDLLFERFISSARNEPPDIDVDFEHERREEVMQYIYDKYGRDRAAVVATVTELHHKGAIRDVGKAMGLSVDTINLLSASIRDFAEEWEQGKPIPVSGFDTKDRHLRKVLQLTREFTGFPRQLGQHTGGFVISEGKLSDLCPIINARMENRTNIEWNKDDIEALGFLKIDVLALGMLTCIRKAFDKLKEHYGKEYTLATVPREDKKVYDMICHADTIGVFQIESRAQMSMLPRLKPRKFYDLVIEVAIVRPGPIQGNMVHPYLKRRNKKEKIKYPSEELEEILGKTLGVPLFQEQAMKIAIVAAGFTPAEADELRRSMATFKAKGKVSYFKKKLVDGMMAKGYEEEYALRIFRQLEGFGSYGFPESHAASFALLVYVSSWLKWYYPDVFACALLNSMPMGFYQPAQLISDARKHGVEVRPVDINHSGWNNTLEEKVGKCCALRLGFRQAKGLQQDEMELLVMKRREKKYTSVSDLRNAGLSDAALERLADADAFRSIGLDRRQALWEVSAKDHPVALFAGQSLEREQVDLPAMTLSEHVIQDYAVTALSLKEHPVHFVREKLEQVHVIPTSRLASCKNGDYVKVAGLVLVRQSPATATGLCFVTIEDETGSTNLVVFADVFKQYRKEIVQAKLLMAEGLLQIEGEVIHVVAKRCYNVSRLLRRLTASQNEISLMPTLDWLNEDLPPALKKKLQSGNKEEKVIPGGRDFK